MSIELVEAPWVRIVASSDLDAGALSEFAEQHGMEDLVLTEAQTPLSKILDAASNLDSPLDTLSEFAGRFCYRSWAKGRSRSEYLTNVLKERHGNVFAHSTVSFAITGVSRSLTHELVRHHVGTNPSQESQRYVTAEGGEIEVVGHMAMRAVVPPLILSMAERADTDRERSEQVSDGRDYDMVADLFLEQFREDFEAALRSYNQWLGSLKARLPADLPATLKKKRAQEAARCFLPNACETRLVFTMNMRAARNVIEQRGDVHADLEIRRLAVAMTRELQRVAPVTFADAEIYTADDGFEAVRLDYSKV